MSICEMKVAGRQSRLEFSRDDYMRRYPRLVAHMICESAGYFTPAMAANALAAYDSDRPFPCEWYTHCARGWDDSMLLKVGQSVVRGAFESRHKHKGCMGDYAVAKVVVRRALAGCGPILASWF